MNEVMGLGSALLSMVFFGLYMAPRQYTKAALGTFFFWMGVGVLVTSSVIGFMMENGLPAISEQNYWRCFRAGMLWSVGALGYIFSVSFLGFSRATPIKNIAGALTTAIGIVVFREFTLNNPLPLSLAVIGSIAVVISGALLGSVHAASDTTCRPGDRRCTLKGILLALGAAVAFAIFSIPIKNALNNGVSVYAFLFYLAHGAFVASCIIAFFTHLKWRPDNQPTRRDQFLPVLAGAIWTAASLFMGFSVQNVGIAVSMPLINLNTVVAIAYGLFVLKDVDLTGRERDFWFGILTTFLGALMLGWALFLN